MKKFFGISLLLTMFLMSASVATAANCPQICTRPGTGGWHVSGNAHWQTNNDFWEQLMDKLGWQETTPDTPSDSDDTDTPNTDTEISSAAAEVAALVNEERAAEGLSPLTLDDELCAAADVRAAEAAVSFSHTRPDGTSCFTALKAAGISYRGAGENIAYGQTTPAAVMADWMKSSGHRANILNANYTKIGVGRTVVNGVTYWAQFFTY